MDVEINYLKQQEDHNDKVREEVSRLRNQGEEQENKFVMIKVKTEDKRKLENEDKYVATKNRNNRINGACETSTQNPLLG